ncbi:MAG: right-handed parallel beta-helix repeat-containing protein [Bacteroidetes bacterium]|nr:right-handed parallel beta-helix repeat-containing protein [Bacteroidota bacterium]
MSRAIQFFLLFLAFIPSLFSNIIHVSDTASLKQVGREIGPGDTVRLAEGRFLLSETIRWRNNGTKDQPILIEGAGIGKTIIIAPLRKTALEILGSHYHLRNLTMRGGSNTLSLAGNGLQVSFLEVSKGDKGIVLSGDTCKISKVWIHDCPYTGIEVNGGYKYLPEVSVNPIRIRVAVRENTYPAHTAYLSGLMESRNMNDTIEYAFIDRCGYRGKAINGGGIKAIPFVSGLYIYRSYARDIWFSAFWIDTPSKGLNEIVECFAENARHGVHIELADSGDVNVVKNCVFYEVEQGIFNSSSQSSVFQNNHIYALKYGIINHGIKDNRVGRGLKGNYINNSIFLANTGKAHVIWYTGVEDRNSSRVENEYQVLPHQTVTIGYADGYSYGDIRDGLESGRIFAGEKILLVASKPRFEIPDWDIPGLKESKN